jgi:hypothetical protein
MQRIVRELLVGNQVILRGRPDEAASAVRALSHLLHPACRIGVEPRAERYLPPWMSNLFALPPLPEAPYELDETLSSELDLDSGQLRGAALSTFTDTALGRALEGAVLSGASSSPAVFQAYEILLILCRLLSILMRITIGRPQIIRIRYTSTTTR